MLTSIQIEYFKSCIGVEIDALESVTALVGRNGVGKSNILRAINWAARQASGTQAPAERAHLHGSVGDVALHFRLNGDEYRYEIRFMPEGEDRRERPQPTETLWKVDGVARTIIASKDKGGVQFFRGDEPVNFLADPAYSMLPSIARLPESERHGQPFTAIANFLAGIRYYTLNEPNYDQPAINVGFVSSQDLVDWLGDSSAERYTHSNAMMRMLAMHLFDPNKEEEMLALVGNDGLGLISGFRFLPLSPPEQKEIKVHRGVTLAEYYVARFDTQTSKGWLGFEDLSHGTRRVLDLVASILYDQSSVMLVEHPEDAVHIGLLTRLMGILESYSEGVQAIIATHSRAILNTLTLTQLRFVSIENHHTQVYRLKDDKLQAAERYISNEGVEGGSIAEFVETMGDVLQ